MRDDFFYLDARGHFCSRYQLNRDSPTSTTASVLLELYRHLLPSDAAEAAQQLGGDLFNIAAVDVGHRYYWRRLLITADLNKQIADLVARYLCPIPDRELS